MHSELLQLRPMRKQLLNSSCTQAHLSAASGMWVVGQTLYVVADDELVLGMFSMQDSKPGQALTIIPGELPNEAKLRKAAKPDFESLTYLPSCARHPYGALLALGSGSTEQRKRGMLWLFDAQQQLVGKPQIV